MLGKRLSDELVKLVYLKSEAGLSQREVAKELHISQKAVWGVLKRQIKGTTCQTEKKLGRPRITTARIDKTIATAVKRNRFSSYSALSHQFKVSRDTIRRRAHAFSLKSRIAHGNVLTAKQISSSPMVCSPP